VLEFSYSSSKLPISTNPECYESGNVLNAESQTKKPLRVILNYDYITKYFLDRKLAVLISTSSFYGVPRFVVTGSPRAMKILPLANTQIGKTYTGNNDTRQGK
jgi:hypothetical protein